MASETAVLSVDETVEISMTLGTQGTYCHFRAGSCTCTIEVYILVCAFGIRGCRRSLNDKLFIVSGPSALYRITINI